MILITDDFNAAGAVSHLLWRLKLIPDNVGFWHFGNKKYSGASHIRVRALVEVNNGR